MTTKEKELKRLEDIRQKQEKEYKEACEKLMHYLSKSLMQSSLPMKILSGVSNAQVNDYPFYRTKKAFVEYNAIKIVFVSEYEGIRHLQFNTEHEVVLANAIYNSILHSDVEFKINDFVNMLKPIFRIIGIKGEWSK